MNKARLPNPPGTYEARAKILKGLAHPSRLMIVETLAAGEKCVCDLRDLVGSDMSTVSKHLSVLKNAGIVRDEKRGAQVYYHLVTPCVLKFFDCIESIRQAGAQPLQTRILESEPV